MNEDKNKQEIRKGRLHFSTRSYPTFGRGAYSELNPPATVLSSPYFWWFRFLQLIEEYKATVEANGVGVCADLYADFGDVLATDFKTWWNEHAYLFAEPRSNYVMQIASNTSELAPFNSDLALNLVVPLTWSQRTLKKRFSELVLSKIEKGKRGVSVDDSESKYKLSGKWHIDALANAYKVYMIRAESAQGTAFSSTNPKTADKFKAIKYDIAWADIAIRAKLDVSKDMKEGVNTRQTSDTRRIATIVAIRHYKRAKQFIKAAITTSFPQS